MPWLNLIISPRRNDYEAKSHRDVCRRRRDRSRSRSACKAGGAAVTAVAAAARLTTSDADREALAKTARFAAALAKPPRPSPPWTENGECREAGNPSSAATPSKAYTQFFKSAHGTKIEVLVKSVRFPANDLAVEEGLIRQTRGPKDLPASAPYVAVHVREGGKWLIALSSELAAEDRLEDIDWLLGEWTSQVKNDAVKITFARDPKKPVITGTFTRTPAGKDPVSGTIRIALDPESGQIRSWGFEDDGAHSQSLWVCAAVGCSIPAACSATEPHRRLVLQRRPGSDHLARPSTASSATPRPHLRRGSSAPFK